MECYAGDAIYATACAQLVRAKNMSRCFSTRLRSSADYPDANNRNSALNLCDFAVHCRQSIHFRWLSFPARRCRLSPARVAKLPSNQAPTRGASTWSRWRYIVFKPSVQASVSTGGCDRRIPVRGMAGCWCSGHPRAVCMTTVPRDREKVFSNPPWAQFDTKLQRVA